MNLLLDTHILIWGATGDSRLSPRAKALMNDNDNKLWFSAASIWETAIKALLARPDFQCDVGQLRAGLLANGYRELAVEGRHAVKYRDIPARHRDPFDRLFIAQALSEGMTLLTADRALGGYGQNVLVV